MTPYQVEWTSTAEDQLAEIWLTDSNPQAITKAQATIDDLLSRNPSGHGAPVQEGLRKITVVPLTAYYEVEVNSPMVVVSAVAHTP